MKTNHNLCLSILFCFFLTGCSFMFCGVYGTHTEFIQDKPFEDQKLQVNQELSIDLDNYWHFEIDDGCGKERVERGSETVVIQDTTKAHFICPESNKSLCSDSVWKNPDNDNTFTLKATEIGITDIEIEVTYSDRHLSTKNFDFNLTVFE